MQVLTPYMIIQALKMNWTFIIFGAEYNDE